MGIRRFTYTLREDQADKLIVEIAEQHHDEQLQELRNGGKAWSDLNVEISPSLPIIQWGQLYYTITIELTWLE